MAIDRGFTRFRRLAAIQRLERIQRAGKVGQHSRLIPLPMLAEERREGLMGESTWHAFPSSFEEQRVCPTFIDSAIVTLFPLSLFVLLITDDSTNPVPPTCERNVG
jgi:hypothetical protein